MQSQAQKARRENLNPGPAVNLNELLTRMNQRISWKFDVVPGGGFCVYPHRQRLSDS